MYDSKIRKNILIPLFSASLLTLCPSAASARSRPEFTAKDLEGNEITEEIFAEKDITMVNIWGTFCGPCVEEMPDLGEISRSMPDNQQMIGLVIDVTDETDPNFALAKKILEKADADFTQIITNADLSEFLMDVTAVPTTIFVDSEGNLLGDAVVGNNVEEYKKRLAEYAEEFPEEKSDTQERTSENV